MRKIVLLLTLLVLSLTSAHPQTWLEDLGKKAVKRGKERAKDKVEDNVNRKVDKTVDDAFDATGKTVKGKDKKEDNERGKNTTDTKEKNGSAEECIPVSDSGVKPAGKKQSIETVYAKSDFVRGDVIIFEDLMDNEQLGEFPSMWDLIEGSAEVISINGKKAIFRSDKEEGTYIVAPLMKNPNNYLPEKYTIEMDLWLGVANGNEETDGFKHYSYELFFYDESSSNVA